LEPVHLDVPDLPRMNWPLPELAHAIAHSACDLRSLVVADLSR